MSRAIAVSGLDAGHYSRHELHAPERLWVEKNCYIDIWIELLHSLGLEPLAMLPFTVALEFFGDQWAFFKPPHEELRELYGLDVQELYVWRPLLEHALEHLAAGRLISTEADAYWLPDTRGTDYRRQHTKTTIVLNALDDEQRTLAYFHNGGYYQLGGEDFERLFRLEAAPDPACLPLYAELIDWGGLSRPDPEALRRASRALLARHVARLPKRNPLQAFATRFASELPRLCRAGLTSYHLWAFGTLRQLGSAAELSAQHLRWLDAVPEGPLAPAAESYLTIANLSKTLLLKGARAVNQQRVPELTPLLSELADAWERAAGVLRARAIA